MRSDHTFITDAGYEELRVHYARMNSLLIQLLEPITSPDAPSSGTETASSSRGRIDRGESHDG